MSEPKFHTGQSVAVLCHSVIDGKAPLRIPKASIGDVVYLRENERFPNTRNHIASSDGWYYSVPRTPSIRTWVHESGVTPLETLELTP
jgi:hypothetical protein